MSERDDDLDDLFAAARRHAPRPDAALLGRIVADAERLLPGGRRERIWRAIGGWPAAVSFLAAGLAGAWIGSAQPEPVEAVIGLQSYDTADLMPGFGAGWEEGG